MSNPVIAVNGDKYWYNSKGELHRLDGPAIEWVNEYKAWWVDGKRHRLDGPASDGWGSKEWWVDGKEHRLDGPAIEWVNGVKKWFLHGKQHRLDGPAEDWGNGDKWWWVDGVKVTEEDYPTAVLLYKCRMVLES